MTEQLLFGQYRIESTIGAGGMAIVYKAHHISLDKHFAIKKLSDSLAQSAEAKERFIREARTHSRLEHPNIVKFHDILQDHASGNVYIVMEYVEGRTLAKMIGKETGPIPFEKAWPIFRQMLEGIGYAHSQGVVHRDIKPGNIIVTTDNKVKILDFGIARDETGHTITQSGQVVGTLQYASPEQIKGERVDQRSDIYNLGMTLYEMVAGRLPHDINPNSSSFHIMQRMLNDEVPDPRKFYPHIPENVVAAIFKAIDKSVEKRLVSVEQFSGIIDGQIEYQAVSSMKMNTITEYERIVALSKMYSGFLAGKKDGEIKIINNVDGSKKLRAFMLFIGLALLYLTIVALSTQSMVGVVILGSFSILSVVSYFQLRFYTEIIFLNNEEIMIQSNGPNHMLRFKFNQIKSVDYDFNGKYILISGEGKYSRDAKFFKNSDSDLCIDFAKRLKSYIEKMKN